MSKDRFRRTIVELLGADLRSLAAFRVLLALCLLADLGIRATDLEAHYTGAGVLPRDLLQSTGSRVFPSLHLLSDSFATQALLFGAAAILAGMLLVGYRTRTATVGSWLLLCSLQARNPLVHQGGDTLLRLLVFWGMFVPLGARWSLDRRGGISDTGPSTAVASVGTAVLLGQVVIMYLFAALLKTGTSWRDGTAVYYALSIDQYATALGRSLLQFPGLLEGVTYATYWLELLGWALLFVPLWTGPIRTLMVGVFVVFQASLGLSMMLGLFPWIAALAMVPFLPSWFWDTVLRLHGDGTAAAAAAPRIRLGLSHAASVAAGLLFGYVILWNVATLPRSGFRLPRAVRAPGYWLRLDQQWGMFAPNPVKYEGWLVIPGTLAGGREVNLLRDGIPVDWRKPELVVDEYKNYRWRKYMRAVSGREHRDALGGWALYLCRQWNERHEGTARLDRLEIVLMREKTLATHEEAPPYKVQLWKQDCPNGRTATTLRR